jgi:hypothetical protein
MGEVNRHLVGVALGLLALGPTAIGGDAEAPVDVRSVFEKTPATAPRRYNDWWRPIKVVPDTRVMWDISERAEAIPDPESAAKADLDAVFDKYSSSAFVFPVLAGGGRTGAALLERYLAPYAGRKPLDDRWLLIIAALGRNATPLAHDHLTHELDRVREEYPYDKKAQSADARKPVIDALLGGLAQRQELNKREIIGLVAKAPDLEWFIWIAGLEWVQLHLGDAPTTRMAYEGIALSSTDDRQSRLSGGQAGDRLRAIENFLGYSPRETALLKDLITDRRTRSSKATDYMLALYLAFLAGQASLSGGVYPIDQRIVAEYRSRNPRSSRLLASSCKILLEYRSSVEIAGWRQFLSKHAAQAAAADESYVEFMIKRTRQPQEGAIRQRSDLSEVLGRITTPGVHLRGFAASGGARPGSDRGDWPLRVQAFDGPVVAPGNGSPPPPARQPGVPSYSDALPDPNPIDVPPTWGPLGWVLLATLLGLVSAIVVWRRLRV